MKRLLGCIMVLAALILPFAAAAEGGGTTDALVEVFSPLASKVSGHRTIMEDGVMKMRPAVPVELAAGETVKLAPGGLHIMLMGLTAPLAEGAVVPITLTFRNAGAINIQARVGPAGVPDDGQGGD